MRKLLVRQATRVGQRNRRLRKRQQLPPADMHRMEMMHKDENFQHSQVVLSSSFDSSLQNAPGVLHNCKQRCGHHLHNTRASGTTTRRPRRSCRMAPETLGSAAALRAGHSPFPVAASVRSRSKSKPLSRPLASTMERFSSSTLMDGVLKVALSYVLAARNLNCTLEDMVDGQRPALRGNISARSSRRCPGVSLRPSTRAAHQHDTRTDSARGRPNWSTRGRRSATRPYH